MSSQKTPLSASKRAVPVQIKILNISDRDNLPYSSIEPRWAFTMTLMPLTKIRELCIHAVGQVQRSFNAVLEAAPLEARDRDGHVFHGMETISEEILGGETIYLVEGEGTGKGRGKERGRLLSLRTGAEQAYRTPSASSRSSSQSRKRAKSQPKMTPSQRALAIARAGVTPRSEPVRMRRPLTSAESLPSPATPHIGPPDTLEGVSRGPDDASSAIGDAPTVPKQHNSVARSQQHSPPAVTSPDLEDSQKVVPDSQDTSSVSPLQSPSALRAESALATNSKSTASGPPPVQPRPAPPLNTLNPDKLQNIPSSTRTLACRPDPYDISTVLSDDENYSPKRPSSIMSSPARKLGTNRRRVTASQPPLRQPQHNINSPSRISKSATANHDHVPRSMDLMNPTTPTRKSSAAPSKAEASSPVVALPSSPTNNVASVIARGRDKFKRQPIPESFVIEDSSEEIDEGLFRNPPGLSASSPEALLPWSQPPLRVTQDPSLGVRPAARRASMSGVSGGAVKREILKVEDDIVDSKADIRRLIDAAKETLAAARDSRKSMAKAYPSRPGSPFHPNSPIKSPSKAIPTTPAVKKPSRQAMTEQATATIARSSDSEESEDGDDEVGEGSKVIKEELSNDESWKNLPAAVLPSSPSHQGRDDKGKGIEVIELSSDSESSTDPVWLDDHEAELPVLAEFPVVDEPLPPDPTLRRNESPAPVVPVQATVPVTDPIESRDNETPPSAQPDKRKRSISNEPNSEDERQRKKAKKVENRKVKKALRKARRRERMALMEEERKKLALEQAHRRALDLEVVVSSPSKGREPSPHDAQSGTDDDSGLDLGMLEEDDDVEDGGVSLYGDDHAESLSSEASEDRLLWLHKKHLSSSTESNRDSLKPSAEGPHSESPTSDEAYALLQQQVSADIAQLESPTSDEAYDQLQQQISADVAQLESPTSDEAHDQLQQQISDDLRTAANKYHRRPFNDWAFLESRLGSGGFGYSPLEVHNRIHLAAVHQSLPAARKPSHVTRSDEAMSPKTPPKPVIEAQETPRSVRCGAPSPKETPAPPQTAPNMGGSKKVKKGKKCKSQGWARRQRNRKRLQIRSRADHNFSKVRETIAKKKKKKKSH